MEKRSFTPAACLLLGLLLLSCLSYAGIPKTKYKDGATLVKAMHKHWQGKWYPNFKFEQRAIFYDKGTVTKEEVWQEIYSQPGQLHIRFDGFDSGKGVIFKQDSVYTFAENELTVSKAQIHPLVLLLFDVYFYKPEETVAKLQQLNFDLSKTTTADWQGRKAIVVGTTNAADNTNSQFWVDAERLFVVRIVTNNNGTTRDVEMNNYQLLENNWVATEIVFKTNGETTMREEYYNMSFPATAEKAWFEPANFKATRW